MMDRLKSRTSTRAVMPTGSTLTHYAILTAMLAPAFFLTATASLLISANNRLARVIDRARGLLRNLAETEKASEREALERQVVVQRRRSRLVLRASQLLYVAISCFVGTSLTVAVDAYSDHWFGALPTALALLGVLAMFAASLLLAREAGIAVRAINEEMDESYREANRRSLSG